MTSARARNQLFLLILVAILAGRAGAQDAETKRTLSFHLGELTFSQAIGALDDGYLRAFPADVLMDVVFSGAGHFSNEERELLALELLSGPGSDSQRATMCTNLMDRWQTIDEPHLRAVCLESAHELGLPATEVALVQAANRLATELNLESTEAPRGGYEIEAMTLIRIAPEYPSVALADILLTITGLTGDWRIVTAARQSIRAILETRESPE